MIYILKCLDSGLYSHQLSCPLVYHNTYVKRIPYYNPVYCLDSGLYSHQLSCSWVYHNTYVKRIPYYNTVYCLDSGLYSHQFSCPWVYHNTYVKRISFMVIKVGNEQVDHKLHLMSSTIFYFEGEKRQKVTFCDGQYINSAKCIL